MRAIRRIMLIAVALVLTGTAVADQPADGFERERSPKNGAAKDALEGKAPPALQVKGWVNTEGGKEVTLDGLRGKVVVLDFWGVWCGPCRAAMPHLKELYARHKDEGLVVIGVHTASQGEKMAEYVKQEALPWPVAVDAEGKTVASFHVDSFPDYYLIDRAGNLRVADLANGELDRAVIALLKEPAPK
jgi:thiol-disulfide isomerase/thioredoxin